MTKSVTDLLKKIEPRNAPTRPRLRASAEDCVSAFLAHLYELQARHVKKPLSNEYLISGCFERPRNLRNSAEVNAYCKVHLVVAIQTFEKLLKQIRGEKSVLTQGSLQKYAEVIRDYLFDLRPLVETLERRRDPTYEFFGGGKNYGVHTWELFRFSRQLAVQSAFRRERFHFDHKVAQITSIFVLRQAMEKKFERLVAVALYDKLGQTPKLRHGFQYDFIANNLKYFEFTGVRFSDLKKLYDWCNVVVHHAFQPLAWQIAFAHAVSYELFAAGDLSEKGGWSVNGGVRILELDNMQDTFIKHFVNDYHHGIWCVEPYGPEAVTSYYS